MLTAFTQLDSNCFIHLFQPQWTTFHSSECFVQQLCLVVPVSLLQVCELRLPCLTKLTHKYAMITYMQLILCTHKLFFQFNFKESIKVRYVLRSFFPSKPTQNGQN